MSSYDPRQLRVILDDLQDYLGIWSGVATDTLKEADYTQITTREQVNRAIHHTAMVKSQAEKDILQVDSKQSEYKDVSAKCEEAIVTAQDTVSKAQEAYQQAQHTFTHWQSELEKALAWLERATIRLEKAKREHEAAKSNYNSAKSDYDRAYRNYKRCMNDKERSNCNSEIRALNRAEDNLESAVRRLDNAIAELNAAIEDYNQAVARVECCRQAVEYAGEAVTYATNAQTSAVNGERMAARSLEYAKEVQKLFKMAKKKSAEQAETASEMNIVVRQATEDTDQAQIHLAQADSLEESAQGYYHRANMELASRVNSLIQLNQPISLTMPTDTSSQQGTDKDNASKPGFVKSKWVDDGIETLAVKDMPDPEGINGASDFYKISMEDMKQGLLRFQEMLPVITEGKGASSDYWAKIDAEKGIDHANGYQRVYDAFFGNDAIKVTFDGKSYDIINGRHRIWLAKQMGIDSLPMNITRKANN